MPFMVDKYMSIYSYAHINILMFFYTNREIGKKLNVFNKKKLMKTVLYLLKVIS